MIRHLSPLLMMLACVQCGCLGRTDSVASARHVAASGNRQGEVFVGWRAERSGYVFAVYGDERLPPAVRSDTEALSRLINGTGSGAGFIVSPDGRSVVVIERNGAPLSRVFPDWRDLATFHAVTGEAYGFASNSLLLVEQPGGLVAADVRSGGSRPWRWGHDADATDDHLVVRRKSEWQWEVVADTISDAPAALFSVEVDERTGRTPFWTRDGQWLVVPVSEDETRLFNRSGTTAPRVEGAAMGPVGECGIAISRAGRIEFLGWNGDRSGLVRTGRSKLTGFDGASPSGAMALMSERTWYGATPYSIVATGLHTDAWNVPAEGRPWRSNGYWLVFEW